METFGGCRTDCDNLHMMKRERDEAREQRDVSWRREERTEADNAKLRAEVEKHTETLQLALVAISGAGICTPVEGYAKAPGTGWLAKSIGELRALLALAEAVCEAAAECLDNGLYNTQRIALVGALAAWREKRGET